MKRGLTIAILSLAGVIAVLYVGDYLSLRYRMARGRDPNGSVTVQRYYALHKERDKTEFIFADPEAETCVYALFPHFAHPPCWYLSRRTERRIDFY